MLAIASYEAMELPAKHTAIFCIVKSLYLRKQDMLTSDIHHIYQKEYIRECYSLKNRFQAVFGSKSELYMQMHVLAKKGLTNAG